jgi:hypothetical protein
MDAPGHLVENWFGAAFAQLAPQLQALHGRGGALRGPCEVTFGKGLAGMVGKVLAKKLGIPHAAGAATLSVNIASDASGLLWSRSFNDGPAFVSHFEPVGHYPDGYWVERSGPVTLRFGVAIKHGAWHWLPRAGALLPRTIASKAFIDGNYVFCVAVNFPLLGTVLSYRGALSLRAC